MGILSRLEARPGRRAGTGYAAAESNRLTASLAKEAEYINRTLRYQLRALRARSRQGAQNNPFLRRFAQLAVDNIAGPCPFRLQAKAKYSDGRFDEAANRRIETEWKDSSRRGNWEITGQWARSAFERLMIRTLCVDGEVLMRKLRGPEYGRHGIKLQLIDTDRLDEQKNAKLDNGAAINMGVEMDANSRPLAYHILKRRSAQWDFGYVREHERVPADEIAHIYIPDFAEQGRGVPWCYAALLNLVHIGAFEEAAVIAARVGATQMGFIQQQEDATAPLPQDGQDANKNPQIDAEPASFPLLPPGYEMSPWNPKYPDAAVDPFLKAMLRGTASGLGVAYHNLANDPADVNFSTARIFGGDEHEMWMGIQNFWIDHWEDPFYANDWLPMQVLMGILPFQSGRLDKYLDVRWQGKRWLSPDPVKEHTANGIALANKTTSRTRIISEAGDDIEDVFDEIKAEEMLAKAKGIDLAPAGQAVKPATAPEDEEQTSEGENDKAKRRRKSQPAPGAIQ